MAEVANQSDQPVSAFELFTKSKDLVIKNISIFGILYIVPFLFALASYAKPSDKADTSSNAPFELSTVGLIGFGAAIAAISVVLSVIVEIMLVIAELDVAKGKKPTLNELWESTKKYGLRMIGLYIVFGFLLVGGLLLFIVPGLIVLRRYFLSPYYLVDRNLKIGEAMKQSASESKPFSGSVWGLIGVSILLSLTAILPLVGGLLSFALLALYSVAPALRYQELKRLNKAA